MSQNANESNSGNPTNAVSAVDDKKAKRDALRNKFQQFLSESKKRDNNAKYTDALEKLKQDPDAEGFNLTCRYKGDQITGLIILNKLNKPPVIKDEPEPETEHENKTEPTIKTEKVEEMDEKETPDAPQTTNTASMRQPKVGFAGSLRSKEPANPTLPPKQKRAQKQPRPSKIAASEALVKGLADKIDGMWREIDRMKTRAKDKKLHKEAKKSLKMALKAESEAQRPKSAKELFYEKLEKADEEAHKMKESAPRSIFKAIY